MLSTNELVGRNLLNILSNNNMKQSELADKLNWNKQVVNKIVHGRKNISVQEIKQICKALNIKIEDLIEEKNEITTDPIKLFMGQVKTQEAKIGLKHAEKIMDMIIFHREVQEEKDFLIKRLGDQDA